MKKIYLLFVMLTLALGVFAQSKGKNAMTLRLVDIKVTDGTFGEYCQRAGGQR